MAPGCSVLGAEGQMLWQVEAEEWALRATCALGFRRAPLVDALRRDERNQLTAAYLLRRSTEVHPEMHPQRLPPAPSAPEGGEVATALATLPTASEAGTGDAGDSAVGSASAATSDAPIEAAAAAKVAAAAPVLTAARQKFSEMDADGSGFLRGAGELAAMVEWVWTSFHPGGEPLAEERRQALSQSLLSKVDTDGNGQVDFAEFEAWFEEVFGQLEVHVPPSAPASGDGAPGGNGDGDGAPDRDGDAAADEAPGQATSVQGWSAVEYNRGVLRVYYREFHEEPQVAWREPSRHDIVRGDGGAEDMDPPSD